MKQIQIDGVWYGLVPMAQPEPDISLTFSHSCQVETDKYVFEAIRLCKDESIDDFYDDIDIKVTDKRGKPWKEEFWDGNLWFNNIVDNDADAIRQVLEVMCHEGLSTFTSFLKKLREIGWLTK